MDSVQREGESTTCLKPHMCNIFVHTALAWFALGQKLIGGAIGAAGRLDAPNDYLCREKFHKLVTPNQIGKLEVCLCLVEHIGLVETCHKGYILL